MRKTQIMIIIAGRWNLIKTKEEATEVASFFIQDLRVFHTFCLYQVLYNA